MTDETVRRYKSIDSKDIDSKSDKSYESSAPGREQIPSIPTFLFNSLDPVARKNLRKWKDLVNSGKKKAPEDLVTEDDLKNDKVKDPVPSGKNQFGKKKGKRQRRVANTVLSGLVDNAVVFKLNSDDESNETKTTTQKVSSSRDDSVGNSKPCRSNRNAKRIRRNIASIGISKGPTCLHPSIRHRELYSHKCDKSVRLPN